MPYPPHDGGAIAMYDVLHGLTKEGHDVTVFTLNTKKHYQSPDALNGLAKKVVAIDIKASVNIFGAFINLFKKTPYNFDRFIHKNIEIELAKLLKSENFDLIQVEGAQVGYYITIIKRLTDTPVVMRAHNVESVIWKRLSEEEPNPLKSWYYSYLSKGVDWYERKYLNQYDKIIAISDRDRKIFNAKKIEVPITVIPAGVNFDRFERENTRLEQGSLFVLGDLNWKPNERGLRWFFKAVWPTVIENCPEIKLHIAGKNTPKWLEKGNFKAVKLHGYVQSATDFMNTYDLMLVPLFSGSGMRLKILEGMALGKNILTTTLGAEGIECVDNKHIFIRDKKEDWIKLINTYYSGKIDRSKISGNAVTLTKNMYDNKIIIKKFIEEYKELVG